MCSCKFEELGPGLPGPPPNSLANGLSGDLKHPFPYILLIGIITLNYYVGKYGAFPQRCQRKIHLFCHRLPRDVERHGKRGQIGPHEIYWCF